MKKKIFYSAVILGNLNNIRCTEEKVKSVKFVLNNTLYIEVANLKIGPNSQKLKDLTINNLNENIYKSSFSDNRKTDLDAEKNSVSFYYLDEVFNKMIYKDNIKTNIKLSKCTITTIDKTIPERPVKKTKELDVEDNKIKTPDEKLVKDAEYVFYYDYIVKIPQNTLKIKYKGKEYVNNKEITVGNNFDESNSDFYNFIINIYDKEILNKEKEKLDDNLKSGSTPLHCKECHMFKNGKDINYNDNIDEKYIVKQLYLNPNLTKINIELEECFLYNIVFKDIKGYNFSDEGKEMKIRTKIKKHQDQQFTEDTLKALIKKELQLKDDCFTVSFSKALNADGKIDEDNIITIEFDIEKIKKDENTKQFISTYLKEKQYVYNYRITNIPSGYKLKSDILKNADQNGFFKGKLDNLNNVKEKINADLGLEEGDYTLEHETDLEKDFNNDSANILIIIKLKNVDNLKDKMFEKEPQRPTGGGQNCIAGNETSNGTNIGGGNVDTEGGNKKGCCGGYNNK